MNSAHLLSSDITQILTLFLNGVAPYVIRCYELQQQVEKVGTEVGSLLMEVRGCLWIYGCFWMFMDVYGFMMIYRCLWHLDDFGTILKRNRILVIYVYLLPGVIVLFIIRPPWQLGTLPFALGDTQVNGFLLLCMRNKLKRRKTRTKPTRPRVNLRKRPKMPKMPKCSYVYHVSAEPFGPGLGDL